MATALRRACALIACASLALFAGTGVAGPPVQQDQIAALKKAMAANQQRLQSFSWIETTTVSLKGDVKSQSQKACSYGPDGKIQKQELGSTPPPDTPRGVRGRIADNKKADLTDYMQQAVALVHQYVPPNEGLLDAAKNAGNVSISPMSGGLMALGIRNYLKPGDTLNLVLNTGTASIQEIKVATYLDSQQDAVSLDVSFASLPDGTGYPAQTTLSAPAKNLTVAVQNANYRQLAAAGPPVGPAPHGTASQAPTTSPHALDQLTAPIALYPDALVAQVLTAAQSPYEVQQFSNWLAANSSLKGSALQDAAQQAGFDGCFVALAPFPQVVEAMRSQPDWTKQLGQAFTSDRGAVFESIQRLRSEAQAIGSLASSEQMTVQTQTTSSGQQVIVIQPANPQVVYVPQYNPQTVYTTPPASASSSSSSGGAAAAGAIGFTAGVLIGAAAADNYYVGPYAWHGAAAYNEAWNNAAHYADQRQDYYQQNSAQRQQNYDQNASQRQAQQDQNATQRQQQYDANAAQRQTSAESTRTATQANRQAATGSYSRDLGGAATARTGLNSGGFSGFQGGDATRAESARGQRSLSSGGGGRRRN